MGNAKYEIKLAQEKAKLAQSEVETLQAKHKKVLQEKEQVIKQLRNENALLKQQLGNNGMLLISQILKVFNRWSIKWSAEFTKP